MLLFGVHLLCVATGLSTVWWPSHTARSRRRVRGTARALRF